MSYPTFKKIYSFSAAGGGVPGKVAGSAHITMTEVGVTTEGRHLFTEIFLPVGEIITGISSGTDIPGNISESLIRNFNAIGVDGKETSTGRDKTRGEFRD